ncbi:hypothetical protein Ndes2437A_g04387 [Nannochloris sp. 'desiccata']|nr:hypothetical protein KSW81_004198 [Chlorella desiccata (nom. nud.)]
MATMFVVVGRFLVVALILSVASAQIFTEALNLDEASNFVPGSVESPFPESTDDSFLLGSIDSSAIAPDESYPSNAVATVPFSPDQPNVIIEPAAPIIAAVGLNGLQLDGNDTQYGEAAAICGANSLQPSNSSQACSIKSYWRISNVRYIERSCSGWIAGDRYIATAGHCLFDKEQGFANSVNVFCKGNNACNLSKTTRSISLAKASKWSGDKFSNPFDGGLIKTNDVLPYAPLPWGERIGYNRTNVLIAGYPGQEAGIPNSPCQRYPQYNGCTQFSSSGTMPGQLNDGYFVPDIDSCKGHSGSLLYDKDAQMVTGIHTGGRYQSCRNVAVPLRVIGVDSGCNGDGGGVGLKCLAAMANRAAM